MSPRDLENLRPLRAQPPPTDPELALGVRILAQAEPLARSEARKRRVWNALNNGRGRRFGLRLSVVHIALAGLLVAAASSAAVGHYYVQRRAETMASAGSAAQGPPRAVPVSIRKARARSVLVAPALESAAPDVAAQPTEAAAHPSSVRSRLDAPSARPPGNADAELLLEAMRARAAGDAQRVSQLVEQYRAKHPQGVLQEEALILSIEAAVSRGSESASALSHEYLKRFPHGRFAQQARRVLGNGER